MRKLESGAAERTWHEVSARSARAGGLGLLVAALALVGPARAGADAASYAVQDLGVLAGDASSVATGINRWGDVVGWSNGSAGTRAFLYTDAAGLVALPAPAGRPRTVARDVNDLGDVVGSANAGGVDLGHAVLWSRGTVRDLGTLAAGSYSEAQAINNLGQVVGWSHIQGGGLGLHAFLHSATTGMVDLTPAADRASAADINDAGQVTGYRTSSSGYYHAFRWQNGVSTDLGVLPDLAFSFGWAISDSGRVAGSSSSASGNVERFIRSLAGGGLQNLGGVGEHNVALGINSAGDVVGQRGESNSRGVRFTDAGGLRDLDSLIDPSLGWVILSASDINDAGQIAAYAHNSFTGVTHAVRLQPLATPPPECTVRCLRSTSITLRAKTSGASATVTGRVTVQDELGRSLAGALVVAVWTGPDGRRAQHNAWTDRRGVATFTVSGPRPGTYRIEITGIQLSNHTFAPSRSVLTKSLAVR